jgi:hypothetical protein
MDDRTIPGLRMRSHDKRRASFGTRYSEDCYRYVDLTLVEICASMVRGGRDYVDNLHQSLREGEISVRDKRCDHYTIRQDFEVH